MTKNSEYNVWNKINLKTAKATKQWDDRSKEEQYSNNEWYVYKEKKGKLHLKHLAYETSIDIPDVKTVHIIDDAGDYVLFDDDQGNDYLCNLRNIYCQKNLEMIRKCIWQEKRRRCWCNMEKKYI